MIAGVILRDTTEKKSHAAFLGDEPFCISFEENSELVDRIDEEDPDIVAVDAGEIVGTDEFDSEEEELKEEGYSFNPASHEPVKAKRLKALKAEVLERCSGDPEFIRFDPRITADELAVHDEYGFESLGIDTSDISSAGEFDAMLGALTARFYEENRVKDLGIIVPEPLE